MSEMTFPTLNTQANGKRLPKTSFFITDETDPADRHRPKQSCENEKPHHVRGFSFCSMGKATFVSGITLKAVKNPGFP